jgi:hypothetical protein
MIRKRSNYFEKVTGDDTGYRFAGSNRRISAIYKWISIGFFV